MDVVLECSSGITDPAGAEKHLKAGAKKVILSAPSKGEKFRLFDRSKRQRAKAKTKLFPMDPAQQIDLAPMIRVLDEKFRVEKGFMTTVHSYTNDQRIFDLPHKDLRRVSSAGHYSFQPPQSGQDGGESHRKSRWNLESAAPVVSVTDVHIEKRSKRSRK